MVMIAVIILSLSVDMIIIVVIILIRVIMIVCVLQALGRHSVGALRLHVLRLLECLFSVHMVVSLNRWAQYKPKHTIALNVGNPD